MFTKHKPKLAILTALLAAMIGLAPALAGTTYNWTGEDEANPPAKTWTTLGNWVGGTNCPGQSAKDAVVIIDDPSPIRRIIQNKANLTIATLFVGNLHEIVMDNPITVTGSGEDDGLVRFQGAVTISGAERITAKGIWVNSKTMPTVIKTKDGATIETKRR